MDPRITIPFSPINSTLDTISPLMWQQPNRNPGTRPGDSAYHRYSAIHTFFFWNTHTIHTSDPGIHVWYMKSMKRERDLGHPHIHRKGLDRNVEHNTADICACQELKLQPLFQQNSASPTELQHQLVQLCNRASLA